MDVGVTLNEDGTASVTTKVSMSEELYLAMEDTDEDGPSKEDFVKEIIDGKTYYSYSETKEYDSYDALATDLTNSEAMGGTPLFDSVDIEKTKDGVYSFKGKTGVVNAEEVGIEPSEEWVKLTLTIKMPGEITDYEGGELLEDGAVRFTLSDLTKEHTLSVTSEVEQFNVVRSVIIWIVGLTIIAVVTITHFKNKKKRSNEDALVEKEAKKEAAEESNE